MIRRCLLAALLLPACSLSGPDVETVRSPDAEGVVVNKTRAPFLAWGLDARSAARADIAPEIAVTHANRDAVVPSGEAAPLVIDEYAPGQPFVVFLYRVRGDVATYEGLKKVESRDFEQDGRVVRVRRF